MGRQKSLIKNLKVTSAKRTHFCKANSKHKILKGDQRLTVKEGQSEKNYCLKCGKKFLDNAIDELSKLRSAIETV